VRPAPEQRRRAGDDAGASGSVVGGVDVETDGDPARAGVQLRADRPQRLGEHDAGAPVEQAVGLGVSQDRHRRDEPLRRRLDDLDLHALEERALGHGAHGVDVRAGRLVGRRFGHGRDRMPPCRPSRRSRAPAHGVGGRH